MYMRRCIESETLITSPLLFVEVFQFRKIILPPKWYQTYDVVLQLLWCYLTTLLMLNSWCNISSLSGEAAKSKRLSVPVRSGRGNSLAERDRALQALQLIDVHQGQVKNVGVKPNNDCTNLPPSLPSQSTTKEWRTLPFVAPRGTSSLIFLEEEWVFKSSLSTPIIAIVVSDSNDSNNNNNNARKSWSLLWRRVNRATPLALVCRILNFYPTKISNLYSLTKFLIWIVKIDKMCSSDIRSKVTI